MTPEDRARRDHQIRVETKADKWRKAQIAAYREFSKASRGTPDNTIEGLMWMRVRDGSYAIEMPRDKEVEKFARSVGWMWIKRPDADNEADDKDMNAFDAVARKHFRGPERSGNERRANPAVDPVDDCPDDYYEHEN
jgi:hypothetical protein